MNYGRDKLHLLRHTLREVLDSTIPPLLETEALKPGVQTALRLALIKTLEAGKEYSLLAYAHLLVEATLLRHIAYVEYVVGTHRFAIEQYATAVGDG